MRVGAFICFLGPPIGSLPIAFVMAVHGAINQEDATSLDDLANAGAIAVLAAIFSYVIGGISAVVSAMWLARRTFQNGGFSYRQAIATALVTAGLIIRPSWSTLSLDMVERYAAFGSVAVFSAVVCRFFIGRLGWIDRTATAPVAAYTSP
ncbi:MAG: hypothetical protein ACK4MF_09135 [Hyphomicrobiaceae bacterium]